MFSVAFVCVSVCLSVSTALIFDNLDLESSFFWYVGTSLEYLAQFYISRSSSQSQGHRSKKACLCVLFAMACLRLKDHLVAVVVVCASCKLTIVLLKLNEILL